METTPADRACPGCGQRFSPSLDVCPNCGRDGANPFVSPAGEEARQSPEWRWLAAVALGVCVASAALAFVAPGLAILLLVVASPVLARAWVVVERRRAAGLPINSYHRAQAIVASGAMLLLAFFAATIACVVVCTPLTFALSWADTPGAIVTVTASGIAALATGIYVMRQNLPERVEKRR